MRSMLGSLAIVSHNPRKLRDVESPGRDEGFEPFISDRVAIRLDCGRSHRKRPARLQRRMRNAPHMPELQEDTPALLVHGLGDRASALHLFGRMDARRIRIADPFRTDLRRLADDETR